MGCVQGQPLLGGEELRDLAAATSLDEASLQARYRVFVSQHPGGELDREAFREMVGTCFPAAVASRDNIEEHIFRMYDDNKDGIIDFQELMLIVYIMSRGSPEQNLRQIFKLLDVDSDGRVSVAEFKTVVSDLRGVLTDSKMHQAIQDLVVEKAFIEMDSDGDGLVTCEEFVAACLAHKKFSTMLTLKLIRVFIE